MYKSLPYDVLNDFDPIATLWEASLILVTLKDPEVVKRIAETGHVNVGLGPADTAKFLRSEAVRYKKIVEDGKITAQ
jgi:hypothetical protein